MISVLRRIFDTSGAPYGAPYVAVLYYALCLTQPQPHPQISEQHRNYNSNMQTVQARYIKNVLQSCAYASSFFSHPHWPYITACCLHSTPSSSNGTAGGSQYIICAKYEIHKTFNQQLQPRGYSSDTTPSVEHYPHHHFPPSTSLWH